MTAKPTLEGAGVHLRRAFGFGQTSDYDPFLLLDDFRSRPNFARPLRSSNAVASSNDAGGRNSARLILRADAFTVTPDPGEAATARRP